MVLTMVYETQKHCFFTLLIIYYVIKSLRFESRLCFLPRMQNFVVKPLRQSWTID